jgi:hypothetical protein
MPLEREIKLRFEHPARAREAILAAAFSRTRCWTRLTAVCATLDRRFASGSNRVPCF